MLLYIQEVVWPRASMGHSNIMHGFFRFRLALSAVESGMVSRL